MDQFNYNIFFSQAIQKIRDIRSPRADRADSSELQWAKVVDQELFDFGLRDMLPIYKVVIEAREISVSCLHATIVMLARIYGKTLEKVKDLSELGMPCFAFIDRNLKELYIFKHIEKGSFWKTDEEPTEIKTFMSNNHVTSCKYIYLMYDFAYLQVIGHNDDETDLGRGTNIYSIMDFFAFYFGKEERERFEVAVKGYIQNVNNVIGYICVKSLTPHALINFTRCTESYILKYPYDKIKEKKIKNRFVMDSRDFPLLQNQFIEEGTYLTMIGGSDFAESIITAEWLYNSMKKAKAVDLTVIGMGYFKSIEQLLFELIKLHKKDPNLDENNFTMGAIATYYKINLKTIFREELQDFTKTYIKEAIFEYKELRNRYFHKHNICDWRKIDEIREITFELAFLALGAHQMSKKEMVSLCPADRSYVNDYYKLCEYMNYHVDDIFLIEEQSEQSLIISRGARYQIQEEDNYIKYFGISVMDFNSYKEWEINEGCVPRRIDLIKLIPYGKNEAKIKLVKVKTIYEDSKFVGTSIVEEEGLYF